MARCVFVFVATLAGTFASSAGAGVAQVASDGRTIDLPAPARAVVRPAEVKSAEAGSEVPANDQPKFALRVRDFVEAIGMNVKFKDVGSQYDDVPGVIRKLRYLGSAL